MTFIFDLTTVLVFFIGAIYMMKKYIKNGSYLYMFIGINSMHAAFQTVKEYIPDKYFILYNILRIIVGIIFVLIVYWIRRKNTKQIETKNNFK